MSIIEEVSNQTDESIYAEKMSTRRHACRSEKMSNAGLKVAVG